MKDESKSKAQLIEELNKLRRQVTTLQATNHRGAASSRTPQFLDALMDTIPVPVFYKDAQGIYRDCNRAFAEQIMGLPCKNIVGHSLDDLCQAIPPELVAVYGRYDQDLLQAPGTQVYEAQVQCADGRRRAFIFHKATLTDPSGQIFGLLGAMVDVTDRKKIEGTLKESEQEYRRLFEALQEGIWKIDHAGFTTLVNPRMAEMLGYTVSEMLGRHLFSFMDEKAVKLAEFNLKRRREGVKEQHDFEFLKKDGTRLYAALAVSPLTDEEGNYAGALAGVIDITERKRAEESLRRRREQYRLLFERMVSGFALLEMIYDETGTPLDCRYVETNPAHEKLTGLKTEEILGRTAREVMPDLEDDWIEAYGQVDRTGESLEIQNYVKELQKWYRVFAYRPQPGFVAITFEDITKHKQAEQTQRRYAERLEALRRVGLQVVAELELATLLQSIVFQAINLLKAAGGGLFLYRPQQDLLEWIVTTDPTVMPPVGSVIRRGEGLSGKVWESGEPMIVNDYQHWSGRSQNYQIYPIRAVIGMPIQWKEEFLGVLIVSKGTTDSFSLDDVEILELFAAQAAVAIKNARLYEQTRQDAETKAMLLQEVNHRVKNSLMGIIGMLYATRRYARLGKNQEHFSLLIDDLVGRIEGLATVHRLLSANEWAPLSLHELVDEIIESVLQSLTSGRQVSTKITTAGTVRVTPKQANSLAVVINELTTNVIKYALSGQKRTKLIVQISQEASVARLEFRDNGPGYPDQVLGQVRHGVGLYLIRAMVQDSLNGELTLQNHNGAAAVIRFPVVVQTAENQAVANSPASQS